MIGAISVCKCAAFYGQKSCKRWEEEEEKDKIREGKGQWERKVNIALTKYSLKHIDMVIKKLIEWPVLVFWSRIEEKRKNKRSSKMGAF